MQRELATMWDLCAGKFRRLLCQAAETLNSEAPILYGTASTVVAVLPQACLILLLLLIRKGSNSGSSSKQSEYESDFL